MIIKMVEPGNSGIRGKISPQMPVDKYFLLCINQSGTWTWNSIVRNI